MAKPKTKNVEAAEVIELRYSLGELPSSQHRAGLAGLVFMINWLGRQRHAKPGVCEVVRLDKHGLVVKFDERGLIQLFNEVYGALRAEQRSSTEWKGQEPLRVEESVVEAKGKATTKKSFVYSVVLPQGAFLADIKWDRTIDNAGTSPWIKLWRDMIWSIMRGVPAQRRPFNERAIAGFDKDTREAWAGLRKPEASVELPSTYFLGAQAKTAENVAFKDRAGFQFLLHFWPFVAQIYVPQTVDSEGKANHAGFAIAIPDIADLEGFVQELPDALANRSGEVRGYRPADSLVDLFEEAALDLFVRLRRSLAQREGDRSTSDLVLGIDIFHMAKEGNNIRVLGAGRVDPTPNMIDQYQRFRGHFWSQKFRRLYLTNLIGARPWYQGFDRLCATTAWKQTIDNKFFKHDARKAFEESNMSDSDTHDSEPTLEMTVYKMVGGYIGRKLGSKHDLDYKQAKEAGTLKEYDKVREKVGREAFLAARSRTGADFVDFFTSTICSTPQRVKREEYELIARALLVPEEIEKVRTLTLLALSARS